MTGHEAGQPDPRRGDGAGPWVRGDLAEFMLPVFVLAGPHCPWAVWAVLAAVTGAVLITSWRRSASRRAKGDEP